MSSPSNRHITFGGESVLGPDTVEPSSQSPHRRQPHSRGTHQVHNGVHSGYGQVIVSQNSPHRQNQFDRNGSESPTLFEGGHASPPHGPGGSATRNFNSHNAPGLGGVPNNIHYNNNHTSHSPFGQTITSSSPLITGGQHTGSLNSRSPYGNRPASRGPPGDGYVEQLQHGAVRDHFMTTPSGYGAQMRHQLSHGTAKHSPIVLKKSPRG
jgi:hypothetical protein